MPMTDRQKFNLLARESNRQFAHAVVYGGLSQREASSFCGWVLREGLNTEQPSVNLSRYLEDSGADD